MYSIHNALLLAAIGLLTATGCQTKQPDQPISNNQPMKIDSAMLARNWDVTIAHYPNGSVPSWADRFSYEASDSSVDQWGWATETPIFLGNIFMLPFTYFGQPYGATVNQSAVNTAPTYTAMVPTAQSAVNFSMVAPQPGRTH